MASPTTVLLETTSAADQARVPVRPVLIAIAGGVAVVIFSIAVGVYYLAHAGKLPFHGPTAVEIAQDAVPTTHALVLEPLLVNLADANSSSYLRVALTLQLIDAPEKKNAKSKETESKDGTSQAVAAVRDTIIAVLTRQTADGLLAPAGKERLKAELKAALVKNNADLKISDVFFTDFLVQK